MAPDFVRHRSLVRSTGRFKHARPGFLGRQGRIAAALFLGLSATSASGAFAQELPSPNRLSPGDVATYMAAFEADGLNGWDQARALAARANDPVLRPTIEWIILADGDAPASFAETVAFIDAQANWPSHDLLRRRAEARIDQTVPAATVLAYFDRWPALTADGIAAHLAALEAAGRREEAARLLRDRWTDLSLSGDEQEALLLRYGAWLSVEDHWLRADHLLWEGRDDEAERLLALLPEDRRLLAAARLRLQRRQPGVDEAVSAVPAALRDDPGLVFERLRWRRRADLTEGAIELLDTMPTDPPRAEAWWEERNIIARRLFNGGQVAEAYRVAAANRQSTGFAELQAAWFSGFLALRHLNRPDLALPHFEQLYAAAETPISLARGAYWLGRVAEASGDADLARRWFLTAGQHSTTFYGQAANDRLGVPTIGVLPPAPVPDPATRAAVLSDPRLAIAAALHQVGEERRGDAFLWQILYELEEQPAALAVFAEATSAIGRLQPAVRAGKLAAQVDGSVLLETGYPTIGLGPADPRPPEALILGLIRQESEFNETIESWAGALGLMQLMPATGQQVARELGLSHTTARLTADPEHNIRLGSTYLGDMLDRYDGMAILAVAAYNAGPGRPDRWLTTLGDPRGRSVDAIIDWIEAIPIYETRNYVQRVLESTQVYRYRLEGGPLMGSLARDLSVWPIR